jgi:hypothetical protein
MLINITFFNDSWNITNHRFNEPSNKYYLFSKIVSYISLLIILLAIIGNTISFIIFRFNAEMKKVPSMIILSFVCITDTASLFTWNFDKFTNENFGFLIENLNMHTCKFFLFLQFFSLQSSGFLLGFVCIDRYFTIIAYPGSFYKKLPFGTIKSATIWSTSIVFLIFLINSYLIILDRKPDDTLNGIFEVCYELNNGFNIYVTWEKIHILLYSLIPSSLMIVFNILIIKKFTSIKDKFSSCKRKKTALTISLLSITSTFIIMTLPAALLYGFFSHLFKGIFLKNVLALIDYLSFLNRASLFINCFITNSNFRKIVFNFFSKSKFKYLK